MKAIVRAVSENIAQCELTYLERAPIDFTRASLQHAAYVRTLETLGVDVTVLPALPDFADSVFIEDAAVILDDVTILCRSGAESRRGESFPFDGLRISPPGTLEGGDVLRIGRTLYVGRSSRTNDAGIAQLPANYNVIPVDVAGCLHLKTACCYVGRNTVLINPAWVDARVFASFSLIHVPESEPMSANALLIGDTLVTSAAHPEINALLTARGFSVRPVDISELEKAEAGVTCLSLIIVR